MSKVDRVRGFSSGVAGTPMTNRKQSVRDRAAMWRMRIFALAFLAALASSIGLWIYDRWVARAEEQV